MLHILRRHSSLFLLSGIGVISGLAVLLLRGPEAFQRGLWHAVELLTSILPAMISGMLLAGSLKQLVPSGALAKWMGAESGWRGLLVATLAGIATPGGPMAAFPLVLVLARAGADRGALIAYIVSWGLNGFHRILVWEMPLLGPEFALFRFLSGLPMGIVAGVIARRLPLHWEAPEAAPARSGSSRA